MAATAAASNTSNEKLSAQIQDAARKHLLRQAESAGLREAQFDVEVVKNAKPVPACSEPVQIEGMDTRMPSRMRFAAVCRAESAWRTEFVVRAHVSASVVVAAAALPAGKPYTAADLALERHDVTATPDPVSDMERAVGMTGKRALRAGDVLRESLLAAPVLVRRGEAVNIVVCREQIEISVAGEAMEAGARDAQVRVRNVSTGNIIRARVIGPATVEPVDMASSTQSSE